MIGADVLAETGRSVATVYHFRSGPGRTAWWGGWALCTVNDVTGELAIQSDWTEPCGYRWNVDHIGCPTLTEFLTHDRSGHYDYLVGKLLPADRQRRFCPQQTVKEMRGRVSAARFEFRIDRAAARSLWDELGELSRVDDRGEFYRQLEDTDYGQYFKDAWEHMAEVPTREAIALDKVILPALVDACRREVARRRLAAAHGPQAAKRCTSDAGDTGDCPAHPTCDECGEIQSERSVRSCAEHAPSPADRDAKPDNITAVAPVEGWGWPINSLKAHYFRRGTALCRRWAFGGELTVDNGPSKDDCAECTRALKKERAKIPATSEGRS